jgi:mannose-1-phosphate guanylyltransferase|tara:strand:+ start:8337 stop:9263 length:927 start_codon:yes stop_codon:yes gene_type:complete
MLDLTLLERVVEAVPVGMVDEVIVAGGYKVDLIESYFRSKDVDFDVRIVPEDEPLGTGGALGNCRDVVSGTFACFNGDIVSSLSIEPMLDLHRKNGGVGTLALWEVEDPTRFGIVGVNEDQRITRFKEKPKPEEVFSNLINAGSYIFQDDIFDWMPKGRHSIERDVFPKLAEENLLNGTEFEGYFIDAGTPDAWMDGVLRCIEEKRFSTGAVVDGSWHAKPKAFDTAHVQGCMIEADVTLQGCHIERSTLLSGVAVGFKSHLRNCLVGRGASVGSNVSMEGVVVDHGSTVPDGTSQVGGQWPKTEPSA